MKVYALVDQNPETGLCRAEVVNQEMVYYFSEYRTNSKALNTRKKEWNELALAKAVSSANQLVALEGIPGSAHSTLSARAFKEICTRLVKFGISAESTDLDDANQLLRAHAPEFLSDPQLFLSISRFLSVNEDQPLSPDEAEKLCEQIQKQWEGVRNVRPDTLMPLHQGIRANKLQIPLTDVYLFVTLGLALVKESSNDVHQAVCEVATTVRRIVGSNHKVNVNLPRSATNNVAEYVRAIIQQVETTKDGVTKSMENFQSIHGSSMLPPDEVNKRLRHVTDADELRLLHDQAMSHLAFQYSRGYRESIAMLDSLMGDLEKLVVSLDKEDSPVNTPESTP
jgi:hypothetical protein